ncbi:MAG: hypothetical protein ACRD0G_00485 [Acidimicrobiales bacterium]
MRVPPTVLAVWTLLIWGVRIRNADGAVGPILLSLTFVALALLVLSTRGRSGTLAVALAGWTALVWIVRSIDIAFFSDRGAGFVLVHLALAVVSILLAAWVGRDLNARARRPTPA